MNSPDFTAKWNFFRHSFVRHWLFFYHPSSLLLSGHVLRFVSLHTIFSLFSLSPSFAQRFICPPPHFFVPSSSLLRSWHYLLSLRLISQFSSFSLLSLFSSFIIPWSYPFILSALLMCTSSFPLLLSLPISYELFLSSLPLILISLHPSLSSCHDPIPHSTRPPHVYFSHPSSPSFITPLPTPLFLFNILPASLFLTIPLTPTRTQLVSPRLLTLASFLSSRPGSPRPSHTPEPSLSLSYSSTWKGGFKYSHLYEFLEMRLILHFATLHVGRTLNHTEIGEKKYILHW